MFRLYNNYVCVCIALADYSPASAVQSCCDSPSLSSPPSYMVPRRLLYVYQSPKCPVASICDLPDVINCQFREFAYSTFGTRVFSVAGPTVWNSLPDYLRDPAVDSEQFRRDLKTHLFARHSKRERIRRVT